MAISIGQGFEQSPSECLRPVFVEVLKLLLKQEIDFAGIRKLPEETSPEVDVANEPRWLYVKALPVQLLFVVEIGSEVTEKHQDEVLVVIVHAKAPLPRSPKIPVLD